MSLLGEGKRGQTLRDLFPAPKERMHEESMPSAPLTNPEHARHREFMSSQTYSQFLHGFPAASV